jgi:hypothetical protein
LPGRGPKTPQGNHRVKKNDSNKIIKERNNVMTDMALALKISGGGLGVVFLLLVVLWFTIWVTKVVTEKITKFMNK